VTNLIRRSPARLPATPVTVENRNNWTVVLSYDNEGQGPYLVDLSHHPRWDIQDSQLDAMNAARCLPVAAQDLNPK